MLKTFILMIMKQFHLIERNKKTMNTYIIMLFDKFTKWLIQSFEITAPTKHRAIKIFKSEYAVDNTYIIKCFRKENEQ